MAVGLWMMARLGRTVLAAPVAVGGWSNCSGISGWLSGSSAFCTGDGSGFELLDLPRYAAALIFAGYLLLGVPAALTFHRRARGLAVCFPVVPFGGFVLVSVDLFQRESAGAGVSGSGVWPRRSLPGGMPRIFKPFGWDWLAWR